MIRAAAVVFCVLAPTASAFADEASARRQYEAGERAYNLGDFDKAIGLFKSAYEEWPQPAFLFNIAQTYRQMGDCKQALFFYKRFLSLKQQDTKKPLRPELKAEVESRIVELEECMKRELASKPPTQLDNGAGPTTTPSETTPGGGPARTTATRPERDDPEDDEPEGAAAASGSRASLIAVRAVAGMGKLGAGDLDTTFQFAGALLAGYPLALGDAFHLELGAAFSFTPVPYTTLMGDSGSAGVLGLAANVAPTYAVTSSIAVRADLGVGVQLISGLGKDGNPFTEGGAPATGTLSTLLARAALSADYAINRNLVITATPLAFSYAPAPTGFLPSISSLTTLSFGVGVGYRR